MLDGSGAIGGRKLADEVGAVGEFVEVGGLDGLLEGGLEDVGAEVGCLGFDKEGVLGFEFAFEGVESADEFGVLEVVGGAEVV